MDLYWLWRKRRYLGTCLRSEIYSSLTAPTDDVENVQCRKMWKCIARWSITDACNRTVEPIIQWKSRESYWNCMWGPVIYTWTYTACDGETTDTYTYTYNIEDTEDPLIEIPQVENVWGKCLQALLLIGRIIVLKVEVLCYSWIEVGSDECSNTATDTPGRWLTVEMQIQHMCRIVREIRSSGAIAETMLVRLTMTSVSVSITGSTVDFNRWGWTNHFDFWRYKLRNLLCMHEQLWS
jgi:hypothetical protein